MSDEAIRKDVSEQEQGFGTSRMEAMNRVSERQKQERAEDETIVPIEEEEIVDEVIEDNPVDDELPGPDLEDEPESPVFFQDGKWMTREKVNGEEREVEFDRVLATAQKHEAADTRLNEASRRLHEIEQRERELAEREQSNSLTNQLPAQGVDNEEVKDLIRQQREAMIDGDDEAYDEVSLKLLNVQGRGNATPEALVEQVRNVTRQELKAKEQQEYAGRIESARLSFEKDNADILGDPVLFNTTNQFSADLLASNPEFTPEQNLAEAAKRTRDWLSNQGKKKFGDERQERKRQTSNPGGANARSKVGKDAPKPKTRSQTIADMKASRGQKY